MSNSEVSKNEMELGVESVNVGNSQKAMYRPRKKKFGRTYINILHDPRVVRGNTYAAFVIPSSLQMEFMRLKEEEERRKRIMKIPKKLPRVALLNQKKSKEEEYFDENEENEKEPDSPQFKALDNPETIEDSPYFYEDKPPTPKFIPLPPGIEVSTQIEDGELFDFDLEVEPILQVLVGRSLLQAEYELIEEDERKEYLAHKKKYEQEREFELINLQRMEAARQRREDEKKRREIQVAQKKLYDIEIQKKLISKVTAKAYLKNLKTLTFKQLFEQGVLKDNKEMKLSLLLQEEYFPQTAALVERNSQIEKIVNNQIKNEKIKILANTHKSVVDKEKERVRKIIEDKETAIKTAEEHEKKRIADKAVRTENRRVNRITNSIKDNILSTKIAKSDVMNIPLCDIDEFTFRSENIHCLGGQLGQTLIVLDSTMRQLAENNTITSENLNIPEVVSNFIHELLLNQLKDHQVFEMRYLESDKFDFSQPPGSEERKKQFIDFLTDTRRLMNKSTMLLLEKEMMSDYLFKIFLEEIAHLYFQNPKDPASIEIDSERQDNPEYMEEIKKQQDEINDYNSTLEKMKKKIRFYFIKAEDLKKKRENVGGFIKVYPNKGVVETIQEIEEAEVVAEVEEKQKEEGAEENKEENSNNGIEEKEKVKEEEEEEDNQVDGGESNQKVKEDNIRKDNPTMDENMKQEEIVKPEPIITNIEYLNEASVFKNSSVPIDSYILHYSISDWYAALTVRSIRRVLKSKYNIKLDLLESISKVKKKIVSMNDWMFDYVLNSEKYLKKTIIPIEVKHEEPKPIIEDDPNNPEGVSTSNHDNDTNKVIE